ncbi:hypothetical protein F751_0100 [Auxenochlorella protothecoides]|uniref:Mic1 domain-containing protein n=1 Tax=Auxenochlorella protothecoides TaxID=3075 RepID=A0A087S9P9_AUXPR|nr:hypothetical protein F751_0100 [Auxenochlorella protothecoides]KFM22453.1 hypothetical protein F751_0100 [Auxenochlorella protothecoides]
MHVVLEDQGVSWVPADGQQVLLDAGAGCLHTVEGRLVASIRLPGAHPDVSGAPATASPVSTSTSPDRPGGRAWSPPGGSPPPSQSPRTGARGPPAAHTRALSREDSLASSATLRTGLVSAGPPVRGMLASLDGTLSALRRGGRQLEIIDHTTGNMRRDVDLLGFFWVETTDHSPQLVMVTPPGLEIYGLQASTWDGPQWWGLGLAFEWGQHEGRGCARAVQARPARQGLRLLSHLAAPDTRWYRFDPESRIALLGFGPGGARLQPLQFLPAGPARLPMLDLGPPWVSSPVRGSGEDPMPRAGACAAHVWLVTLYGQVHCAHHEPPQRSLRLFRIVVDNLLAVHLLAAHVTLLYDVAAPGAEPLCAPLPIGGARLAPGGGVAGGDGGAGGGGGVDDGDGGAPRQEDGPQAADRGLDGRALVPGTHSGGVQGGTALADAAQECGEGYAPDSAEGLADAVRDGEPLLQVRRGFDAALRRHVPGPTGIAGGRLVGPTLPGPHVSSRASSERVEWHRVVVGGMRLQQECMGARCQSEVLRPLLATAPPQRLLACTLEFVSACQAAGAEIDLGLGLLVLDLLTVTGEVHRLRRLLDAHPPLASSALANTLLLTQGPQSDIGPPLHVFSLVGDHAAAVALLLRGGEVEAALHLARRHRVATPRPAAFLERAAQEGNPALVAALHRLCSAHSTPRPPALDTLLLAAKFRHPGAWPA